MRWIAWLIAVGSLPLAVAPATAQSGDSLEYLGSHRDWNVYTATQNEQKLCYIASVPQDKEPKDVRRGDVAVLVTLIPSASPVEEVNVQAGYPYDTDRDVEVDIDGRSFDLFTHNFVENGEREGHAYAKTESDDRALIQAMRRGIDMVVRGRSTRGTMTTDRYSLLGFTAAYDEMTEACEENG